jgi:transposase-like protein
MHCPRCQAPMLVVEHVDQLRSAQTWYQCPACDIQRLVSVDKTHFRHLGGVPPAPGYRTLSRGKGI